MPLLSANQKRQFACQCHPIGSSIRSIKYTNASRPDRASHSIAHQESNRTSANPVCATIAPAALAAPVATSGRTQTQATAPQKPNPRSAHHSAKAIIKTTPPSANYSCSIPMCCCTIHRVYFALRSTMFFLPLIVLEELDDHKKA